MTVDDLQIRSATAEDRAAVLAFCHQTWSWGDYIEEVWADWLADPSGSLRVGEVAGEPVALCKLTMLNPQEAWLEGLRISPSQRGRGYSYPLIADSVALAQARGAQVIRMATGSGNQPVHRTAASLGFRAVACFTPYEAEGQPAHSDEEPLVSFRLLLPADEEATWQWIATSPLYKANGGLYGSGWSWLALDRARLRDHLAKRQVVARLLTEGQSRPPFLHTIAETGWRKNRSDNSIATAAIHSLAIITGVEVESGMEVGYADCISHEGQETADYALLGTTLRRAAASLSPPRLSIMLPDAPGVEAGFARAGYQRDAAEGSSLTVFEQRLLEPASS